MAEICVSDNRRRSGWFWLDNKIFDMGLDPYEFLVYAFLVRIADRGSEVARISTRNLAKKLRISRQRAINALRKLEELNMIQIKPQLGKNGNRQANMYVLTSQEEWVVYEVDQGWSTRKTRVVYEIDQGGLRDRPGVVYEIDHPPEEEGGGILGNQGKDKTGGKASKIYSNKNISINNHHHQYKGNGKVDGGDDAVKEKKGLVSRRNNSSTNSSVVNSPSTGETNQHSLKPLASLRENSAAGELAGDEPSEVFKALKKKWGKYLNDLETERLTLGQVLFFLENSALPAEQTLEAILKDDRNPSVKNPVGTLYSTLPLKSDKYRWLLKWRTVEDEEWYKLYTLKADEIKAVADNLGINWEPVEPSSIDEAQKVLRDAERKIAKAIYNSLNKGERKELKDTLEKMYEGREATKKEKQSMLKLLLLERRGIHAGLFELF